jgi:hypothetical protein
MNSSWRKITVGSETFTSELEISSRNQEQFSFKGELFWVNFYFASNHYFAMKMSVNGNLEFFIGFLCDENFHLFSIFDIAWQTRMIKKLKTRYFHTNMIHSMLFFTQA